MNNEEHIRIARDFYDRIGRLDFDGAGEYLDENVETVFPYSPLATDQSGFTGKVSVLAALKKSVPRVADRIDFTYDNFYPGQDPGVLTMQFHSSGIRARGKGTYENVYVTILRFRDSKIVYWAEYFDVIRGAGGLDKLCGRA